MANAPLRFRPAPRPGAPTEADEPEEYERGTAQVITATDVVEWATKMGATQIELVTGGPGALGSEQWVTGTDLQYENWYLRHENVALQRRVEALESRMSRLEATAPEAKVVVLREITKEQAKQEIRELFSSGEVLDYEDIVDRLQLGLKLVVDTCNELIEEGEIGPGE